MTPAIDRTQTSRCTRSGLIRLSLWVLIFLIPAGFWLHEGWFHIELLHISEVLSQPPHNSTLLRQFLVAFDWKEFELLNTRLRPLSDLVEVVDAIMRPWRIFGFQPSLTVVSIGLAGATIWAFYGALLRLHLPPINAVCLTLLMVTTIGFLSCYVPYIRPAKKLVFLGTALTLLFSASYRDSGRSFWALWWCVFFSLFCDEAGFILWPIALMFVCPRMFAQQSWLHLGLLFLLPLAYVLTTTYVVPSIYGLFSVPRVMSFSAGGNLVAFLWDPRFYRFAARITAATILVSLGVAKPATLALVATMALMLGILAYGAIRRNSLVLAAAMAVLIMSIGLSLFDMFNFRFDASPLAWVTYYYHSPVAILTLFLVAGMNLRTAVLVPIVILVGTCNLHNFYVINRTFMIEHNYPAEARSLPAYVVKPQKLDAEFHTLVIQFGSRESQELLQRNFAYYKIHPMGDESFCLRYRALFQPHNRP